MQIIRLLGLASGAEHPDAGRWLMLFDVDARDGQGEVWGTDDKSLAYRFDSSADAFATWNLQSTVRPLRTDGQPNRPLTAFTIEVVDADGDW